MGPLALKGRQGRGSLQQDGRYGQSPRAIRVVGGQKNQWTGFHKETVTKGVRY